ncbi:hypothetical protein ILYODFUR_014006 [Ilyodon furcidens]|uniref:Uncharacterized protein n=1 Tax=Ilyodon furcidens TaxID=33524 RepID=A0ABV0T7V4_9TELE
MARTIDLGGGGKIFIGNKKDIAESRIPELNTYMKRLLGLPTWLLLDESLRMFFYQTEQDSQHEPRALRRLRPPTRKVKTVKAPNMDLFSSPRAEVLVVAYFVVALVTITSHRVTTS